MGRLFPEIRRARIGIVAPGNHRTRRAEQFQQADFTRNGRAKEFWPQRLTQADQCALTFGIGRKSFPFDLSTRRRPKDVRQGTFGKEVRIGKGGIDPRTQHSGQEAVVENGWPIFEIDICAFQSFSVHIITLGFVPFQDRVAVTNECSIEADFVFTINGA